jgi:hypothetical protein
LKILASNNGQDWDQIISFQGDYMGGMQWPVMIAPYINISEYADNQSEVLFKI